MKKIILTIFIIGVLLPIYAQVATPPSVGDGTEISPYQIANLENLYWIAADTTNFHSHYIQTADINADETRNWFDGQGWKPIGNYYDKFTGVFDGQSYNIDSLFINYSYEEHWDTYYGLFGRANEANLMNINLNAVNISSLFFLRSCVGALVGGIGNSNISNCSSAGIVTGFSDSGELYIGGLIGSSGTNVIENCYSICKLESKGGSIYPPTGGLIGISENTIVTNCYGAGKINAEYPRGLIGWSYYNGNTINNSFWDIETTSTDSSNGGIGLTTTEMQTLSTFTDAGWDFVGESTNGTEDIWDRNNINNFGYPFLRGQTFPAQPIVTTWGASNTSLSTAEVIGQITSIGDSDIYQHGICWNITGDPTVLDSKTEKGTASVVSSFISTMPSIYSGTDYYIRSYAYNSDGLSYGNEIVFTSDSYLSEVPTGTGTAVDPYQISTLGNLLWIRENNTSWGSYFQQANDINAYDTKNWSGGKGWNSIGNGMFPFTGIFDGAGYDIGSLYINNPGESYRGLFGIAHEAEIKNINISQAYVSGIGNIGILAGLCSNSIVNNCFTSGSVEGEYYVGGLIGESSSDLTVCRTNVEVLGSKTGGLVGYNRGVISQSCSRGTIIGDNVENNMTGGLVGWNISEINNCFSSSDVDDAGAGGLVGFNDAGSMIRNSFSYGIVNGRQSGGLVGFLEYKNNSENSFWDIEASTTDSSATGTGLNTVEMKILSTFTDAGWDFVGETANGTEDIWDIDGTTNNGYPFLSWMSTGIMDNGQFTIDNYALEQNYPNPFNPTTTINFFIPQSQDVKLSIFNSNGQLVKELINDKLSSGNHSVKFNAENLNSGIYFYTLHADGKKLSNKMLLIK